MDKKIKLPEIVMLIDAAFLNYVISDLKSYFEKMLNRPLREIDLSLLTTYLVLDAGISEGDNKAQLLFVYDKDSSKLLFCKPADLKEELNGVAFSSQFGEFSFAGVPCEEMVTREELFLDLLGIVSAEDLFPSQSLPLPGSDPGSLLICVRHIPFQHAYSFSSDFQHFADS